VLPAMLPFGDAAVRRCCRAFMRDAGVPHKKTPPELWEFLKTGCFLT
jgi:hypothetical protein